MVLFRKLCFTIVLLAWVFVGSFPIHQNQHDTISSALRAREFEKAVELSRSALRESPNNAQLWTLQGIAFASKGDSKEALAAFQQALKILPNSIAALAGAAQIEYEAGNRDAVPLLNRLLQLRPGDPTGHAMLAVLEYRQGNCGTATPHFEKAGELLDSQLDALHAYATCLVKLKRLDDAVTVFQRAVALHPDDRQERNLLASIQLMVHKPQDALATLGPLLEASNPSADTLELASNAYEDSGDTPQAVSALRQALLLDRKSTRLNSSHGYISYAVFCLKKKTQ